MYDSAIIYMVYVRDQLIFSVKGQIINIFGFVGHMVSAATTQLRHYSTKAAIFHTEINVAILQ